MVRKSDALRRHDGPVGRQGGYPVPHAERQQRARRTGHPRARSTATQLHGGGEGRLFAEPDITIWQDTVDEVLERADAPPGFAPSWGRRFEAPHVILTTGTFLCGLIHVGLTHFPAGASAIPPP